MRRSRRAEPVADHGRSDSVAAAELRGADWAYFRTQIHKMIRRFEIVATVLRY